MFTCCSLDQFLQPLSTLFKSYSSTHSNSPTSKPSSDVFVFQFIDPGLQISQASVIDLLKAFHVIPGLLSVERIAEMCQKLQVKRKKYMIQSYYKAMDVYSTTQEKSIFFPEFLGLVTSVTQEVLSRESFSSLYETLEQKVQSPKITYIYNVCVLMIILCIRWPSPLISGVLEI